jgi:large subunit ribosomal protein L13
MATMKYTIDAQGKRVGVIAADAARMLMGKRMASYRPNVVADVEVTITNAAKLDIPTKRRETKYHKSFSGYPGGLRKTKLVRTQEKFGNKEVVEKAVWGMLPKNKLRAQMIKRLKVSE